jgi:hypothetical protein
MNGWLFIHMHALPFCDSIAQKKYNLTAIVVFITLVEGLAISINILTHPELRPGLTAGITLLVAIVSGLMIWYATRVRGILLA